MTADSESERESDLFRRTGLTRAERSLRGSLAVHERWAREPNRLKATEKMRAAALKRFEDQVDPEGVMTEATRRKLGRNAQIAHMRGLALKREKARRLAAERQGGDDDGAAE